MINFERVYVMNGFVTNIAMPYFSGEVHKSLMKITTLPMAALRKWPSLFG